MGYCSGGVRADSWPRCIDVWVCSGGVRADSWPSCIDVWVIVVVELELIHGHAV